MVHVVKRRGHKQKFDERKLYASIYAACLLEHMDEEKCEKMANHVTKKVKNDLKRKSVIESDTIFRLVIKHLVKKDKEAAYI